MIWQTLLFSIFLVFSESAQTQNQAKNLFNKPLNLVNHCTARLATVSTLSKTIIVSGN